MPTKRRKPPAPIDWEASLSPEGDDLSGEDEDAEAPPSTVAATLEATPELLDDATLEQRTALLPANPGVYLMRDARGVILYVGKAQNLRIRVRSYFRPGGDGRAFVEYLQRQIHTVDFIVTDTEKEALLLENTLIKKHRPRYNIRLRDDKTYVSLRLDPAAEWPRLHRIRRRRAGDKALYFGPYASSSSVKETMRFLQRLFPIRSCPDTVLHNRSRPCILHQIGRCAAPCVGKADAAEYRRHVEATVLFLKGRRDEVLRLLEERMMEFSETLEFEKAALVRDRLRAIRRTVEQEKVQSHRAFDRDVVALHRSRGWMLFTVLYFRAGRLEDTRHSSFKDHGQDDRDVMESFLLQHYDSSRAVPRDVLTSHPPADPATVAALLAELRGGPVRLKTPERGDKRRVIELALANGSETLDRLLAGEKTRDAILDDLQRALSLPRLPRRIECFDISNFQGSFPVASMTCFIEGEPSKADYRHFKIKAVEGQDDFAMMREVVRRRYARVLAEGGELPDLVVIDGGKGQLNAACEALREAGALGRFPVIGLAKSRILASSRGTTVAPRSEERVFLPGRKNPVFFTRANPALFLLMRIRDEAHRFGVTFHRKQRSMASLKTGLEGIAGLGPVRQRKLLKHFGSVARIRAASLGDLAAAPGMTVKLASAVAEAMARAAN
ncbi:MAG: excinuclease ABC subunit UvrC [Candidatus Sumerlaeia bacterium]|nr:excinuclease ABC subunit UvrC [Candidatus Sumerlaeia bacterium]